MGFAGLTDTPIIDCHAHLWMLRNKFDENDLRRQSEALVKIIGSGCLSQMHVFDRQSHAALYMKVGNEGMFYAGGYAPWTGETRNFSVDWQSYIKSLISLGYDGVGEMGSKPVTHDRHVTLDSNYYEGFWDRCEDERFPVLCHVGDVEDFWHEDLTPGWAKSRGWGYWKGDYPCLEELYAEIEHILGSHPKLKIVFCHLLFMSTNLERLEEFFRNYQNANVDLSLGVELLHNISSRRDDWRAFIMSHDDRFFMGTDIGMSTTLKQHLARIWLLRKFLESDEEFYTPDYADDLLTRYKEPYIGLDLPRASYEKIYAGNFRRLWGARPRKVNREATIAASERGGEVAVVDALKKLHNNQ